MTDGRITIDGVDVRDVPQDNLRQIVGIAFQDALLFQGDVRFNLKFGQDGTVAALQQWVILAVIAAAVYLLFSLLAERIYADLATRALAKLQNHLFSHLQSLSLNFFDRQPLGELLSRVANDSEVISLFYEQGVSPIIRSITQIVMILLVMLIADWRLTLVALIVVPFMLIAALVIERASSPAFAALQDELGSLSGFQEETLSGHKVIISKRRQDWAVEQSNDQAKEAFDLGSKAFFNALLQYPLTMSFSTFQIVLVLVAGGLMVIAFSGYAALLASPLSQLANLTSTTLNAVAGGRRVFEIIDEDAQIADAPDAVDYEFKGGRIEFQDVDFSYVPGRKILRGNTFVAEPGQAIGICGPTGAGKSTIINILTCYYETDSGNILIDGQNLRQLTQTSLRR